MKVRINSPHVIAEFFEDEVVAVNFKTGSYYGLNGTALELWRAIQDSADLDSVIAGLAARYSSNLETVRVACESFLGRLAEEELVINEDGRPAPLPSVEAGNFPAPELHVYQDMKDLLLLDPIHDVDETGWPAAKPGHDAENSAG